MNDYIQLSTLNDFIFCPYSIYLHSVYMESDGDLYKAAPQTKGTLAHQGVDEKKGSTRKSDIMSLPVYCDELGISGKIDVYKQDKRLLIERKNNLKRIFRGQIYQLWGQWLWFKRKSLVCDLMEPFRCIIDHALLLAFNRKQFSEKDFTLIKQEYHLKYEKCADYYRVFYDELIARKMDIFKFVQQYYRCFMGCKSVKEYPIFEF